MEHREAYNWSSSIQAGMLNRYHCIFIGFSAEDYNFRRIIRQTAEFREDQYRQQTPEHSLVLVVDDWVKAMYENVCWGFCKGETLQNPDETAALAARLLRDSLDVREKYWNRFGFHPIWTTAAEIGPLLASLA